MIFNCSTCFGRHIAHHQELKNCNCSLWIYIRCQSLQRPATYVKPEAAITIFELLMMGGGPAARLLRSWVRISPGAWIFVCCECRVLSGRGLCDELITRLEESYRLCRVVVCDLETSRMGASYIHDISSLKVNN